MAEKAESVDRRILKTRLALRDALLALLATKSWDEISIQEICHQANVGRSTFYLRYQGKEDLLEESLNDLRDFLIANTKHSGNKEFTTLHGLLEHIAEQRAVFKAV